MSTPGDWRREMRAEAARVVLLHTPVDGVCFGCLVESGKVTRWPCLPRHEWVRVAHVMRPQNP